jgi:hypothetical protein
MPMNYEELDDKTRSLMLKGFEAELAGGNPGVTPTSVGGPNKNLSAQRAKDNLYDIPTQKVPDKIGDSHRASGGYRSSGLNDRGWSAFLEFMRAAIRTGTEVSLIDSLNDAGLWKPTEIDIKNGVPTEVPRHVLQSATRLGLGEFSTWYVHGLARRLLDEGETQCQIYRGQPPVADPQACSKYEGMIVNAQLIYDNHRARYWPEPGNKDAIQVPFAPWCHHVIQRVI